MMDVVFQLNLELMLIFFDYDDRIICELLEFGAPVGFESNILEENKDHNLTSFFEKNQH
jgi:hypothetical protein